MVPARTDERIDDLADVLRRIYEMLHVAILGAMKHLVDLDEQLLSDARTVLGTETIKDTVNTALRLAAAQRRSELDDAVDQLADLISMMSIADRSNAW